MDGRARPGRKEGGGEVREWVGRNLHCTECHQFRKRISRWTVKPDPQLNHTISCITRTMQGRTRTRESSVLVSRACRNERRLDRSRHLDFAQKLLTGRFTSSYSVTVPLLSLPYVQARSDMWMTTRRGGWALMPLKYQTVPVSS